MNIRTINPAIVIAGKSENIILWAVRIPIKEIEAMQSLRDIRDVSYIRSRMPKKDATIIRTVRGCP